MGKKERVDKVVKSSNELRTIELRPGLRHNMSSLYGNNRTSPSLPSDSRMGPGRPLLKQSPVPDFVRLSALALA